MAVTGSPQSAQNRGRIREVGLKGQGNLVDRSARDVLILLEPVDCLSISRFNDEAKASSAVRTRSAYWQGCHRGVILFLTRPRPALEPTERTQGNDLSWIILNGYSEASRSIHAGLTYCCRTETWRIG